MHVRGFVTLALVGLVVVALLGWFASSHDARDASTDALVFDARTASAGDVRSQSMDAPDDSTKKTATTSFPSDAQMVAAPVASPVTSRTFRLAVFDDEAPADVFGARVFSFPGGGDLQFVGPKPRDSHVLDLVVPDVPFVVRALAECCETKDEGPFDPATVPGTIETHLTPSPGFEGIVLAGGVPVDGAEVMVVSQSEWLEVLLTSRQPSPRWSTLTSRGGRFDLRVGERGHYALRIAREGFATLDIGPFELDGKTRHRDLQIVLGRGGRIEGHLLDANRVPIAAREVVVTTGTALFLRAETDGAGRFAFDALAAGTWRVGTQIDAAAEHTADAHSAHVEVANGPVPPLELAWRVDVVDGMTSRIEIVLSRSATLDVELAAELGAYGTWIMHSECGATASSDAETRSARAPLSDAHPSSIELEPLAHEDRGLRQRLTRLLPGKCQLTASTKIEEEERWTEAFVVAPIEVGAEAAHWTFAPEFGALEVELGAADAGPRDVSLLWTGPDGQFFGASTLARRGIAFFPAVPVGACTVRIEEPTRREAPTTIARGVTTRVRL